MPLEEGLVLAIEPMFNLGTPKVRTLPDRWTVVTVDRKAIRALRAYGGGDGGRAADPDRR